MFPPVVSGLVLLLALGPGCGATGANMPAYDGTVILGDGYVQVLVTAPADQGCPPRIHRAGTCVRSAAGAACAVAPACVTEVAIASPDGNVLARTTGTFARVPPLPPTAVITIRGCGGTLTARVDTSAPVEPVAATAQITDAGLAATWRPAGTATQMCVLATGEGFRELCCALDTGSATLPMSTPGAITSARASLGALVLRKRTRGGTVEYYRTAETGELLVP